MKKLLFILLILVVGFLCYRYSYVFKGMVGKENASVKSGKDISNAKQVLVLCKENWDKIQAHKSFKEEELRRKNLQYAELQSKLQKLKADYKKYKEKATEEEYYEYREQSDLMKEAIAHIEENIKADNELLKDIKVEMSKAQMLVEMSEIDRRKLESTEAYQKNQDYFMQVAETSAKIKQLSKAVDSVIDNAEMKNLGRTARGREKYGSELE